MKHIYLFLITLLLGVLLFACAGAEKMGDYEYELMDDGTATITRYNGNETELVIPAEIDGHGVTGIANGAFFENRDLMSVIIPDGMMSIGDGAFFSCYHLTSVTIPDTVISIGNRAFESCSLTSVDIPDSVVSIGYLAFAVCSNLTNVSIPDSVTTIGINPFLDCRKMMSIQTLPDHSILASIDGVLFSKMDKQLICYPCAKADTTYSIPDGIRIIGMYSFYDCDNIMSVTIPDSVTSIESDAFSHCNNLSSVTIPDSVTSIGNNAFDWCSDILVINVPRDSYAAQYCKENGLNYTYPDADDWLNN